MRIKIITLSSFRSVLNEVGQTIYEMWDFYNYIITGGVKPCKWENLHQESNVSFQCQNVFQAHDT